MVNVYDWTTRQLVYKFIDGPISKLGLVKEYITTHDIREFVAKMVYNI